MDNRNTTEIKVEQNVKRLPTKEECLASYEVPIPEETLALAAEKGLHIQRCDEVVTKRKRDGKSKGKIQATAKQAKGIRQTKICSYNVYNSQGKKVSKGSFKLKLEDLVTLVEQYESTGEDLATDEYMPPFKHLKEKKHLRENRTFLKKIGKDLKYENGQFWIVEQNGDVLEGSKGFSHINHVSSFIRKNLKNAKRVKPTVNMENKPSKKVKKISAPAEKKAEKTIADDVVDYSEIKEKLLTKKYIYITSKRGTALYKIVSISNKKMQITCNWVREEIEVDPVLVIDETEVSMYRIIKNAYGDKLNQKKDAKLQKDVK